MVNNTALNLLTFLKIIQKNQTQYFSYKNKFS